MLEIKITLEKFSDIRDRCRQMPDLSHTQRGDLLAKDFPGVSPRTLEMYSRVALGATEKVWNLYREGKTRLSILQEIYPMPPAEQDAFIDECIAKNIPPSAVVKIRRYKKEYGWGYAQCIQKALEEIPPNHQGSLSPEAQEAVKMVKTEKTEKTDKPEEKSPEEKPKSGLLPGETTITRDIATALRKRCQELPGITHEARASSLIKDFPGFNHGTLKDYSRICTGCTEKVWNLYMTEKVGWSLLSELCSWEQGDQNFLVDECIEKKIGLRTMRKIRKYRVENKWGFPECIAKATGEVDAAQPRKETGHRKGLDGMLTEIADKGARWRAMVTQAIELIGKEEAEAGIHEAIFTKVFLLRELIGNQYDFVNSRLNRYMNMIRKRLQGDQPVAQTQSEPQGGPEGDGPIRTEIEGVAEIIEPEPEVTDEGPSVHDRASRHGGI